MNTPDEKWKKEVEDFVFNMSEAELDTFLEETGFDFYNNVKTRFLGLTEIGSEQLLFSGMVQRPQESLLLKECFSDAGQRCAAPVFVWELNRKSCWELNRESHVLVERGPSYKLAA